jgi:beta-lactamase superfamily II metal-dependent hydrolase
MILIHYLSPKVYSNEIKRSSEDNHFGHPVPEVLERYAEHDLTVLRTDEQGTIELSTDGERLWVETGR